jgi:hypothetical protein
MKKILIGISLLVLIIIGIGLFMIFRPGEEIQESESVPTPIIVFPTISEDVKIELLPRSDKRAVVLKIKGFSGEIQTIDYEMRYTTKEGLLRGINGTIKIRDEKEVIRDDLTLGSCSTGGKCTYDEGVQSVDLTLKFNSLSGTSYIFQKNYPL